MSQPVTKENSDKPYESLIAGPPRIELPENIDLLPEYRSHGKREQNTVIALDVDDGYNFGLFSFMKVGKKE